MSGGNMTETEKIHFLSLRYKRRMAGPVRTRRKGDKMKKCQFCSKEVRDEAVECPHCGERAASGNAFDAKEACTDCGAAVPVNRGFCPKCGVIQVRRGSRSGAVKCPSCHSSQIERISAAKKAVYVALLGILAPAFKSTRSQFKCNACGNKW
jgi:predicted RNA-binding Zn-ribbon protein involved in translation (DUF1610 family)